MSPNGKTKKTKKGSRITGNVKNRKPIYKLLNKPDKKGMYITMKKNIKGQCSLNCSDVQVPFTLFSVVCSVVHKTNKNKKD